MSGHSRFRAKEVRETLALASALSTEERVGDSSALESLFVTIPFAAAEAKEKAETQQPWTRTAKHSKAPAAVALKRRYGAPRRRKDWRTPRPCGFRNGLLIREASWTVHPPQYCYGGRAAALYRFSHTCHADLPRRIPKRFGDEDKRGNGQTKNLKMNPDETQFSRDRGP